ncbi:MAG: DUF169 domain-containing protein [Dehalococcoidales bacterium]|nr:DUF169 domain-containing protein [Dehalococcoidales bacterium]
MGLKREDFAVLEKFAFERRPVCVRFTATRPQGINRIAKELNFCEMLKEAQEGNAFYVTPDDWVCVGVEQMILGIKDPEPALVSGAFGGEEGLFQSASACRAMYDYLPRMQKGSVKYVVFAPVDKLSFDPDLLIITANTHQAQTVLRCINYVTGQPFVSRTTPVVACAWIYVYPVVSGELNYVITGLGLGMQALNIFPPGLFIISIPFQRIPMALSSLRELPYRPTTAPGPGGQEHRRRVNRLLDDIRKRLED